MEKIIYRHGDVGLSEASETALAGARKVEPVGGRVVLALGEVTGHAHTIAASACELFETATGRRVLVVGEQGASLTHQEHHTLHIAPGTYWVVHQREYTPAAVRRVMD